MHSCGNTASKRLKLVQRLGQLGVFLTWSSVPIVGTGIPFPESHVPPVSNFQLTEAGASSRLGPAV
jgi:hypothetical protein